MKCDECNSEMRMEFSKYYRTDFYFCENCGLMIFPRFSPETVTSFNLERSPRDRLKSWFEWYENNYREWSYELDGRPDHGPIPSYEYLKGFKWESSAKRRLKDRLQNVSNFELVNSKRILAEDADRIRKDECPECKFKLEKDCLPFGTRDGKYHSCKKRCVYVSDFGDNSGERCIKFSLLYVAQHIKTLKHEADMLKIKDYMNKNPGASVRKIARDLILSKSYVGRLRKEI
jgi:hypothetical protein